MRKMIPVLVALVLIAIIIGVTSGKEWMERSSYSQEREDLGDYFGVSSENELAIVLQDDIIEEKALLEKGRCYFDRETAERYFCDDFYISEKEGLVLYTTPSLALRVEIGGTSLESAEGSEELEYAPVIQKDGTIYMEAEFLKRFANFSVELFDRHVQLYTEWGSKTVDYVTRNTSLRTRGGKDYPILADLEEDSEVEVLEAMEEWSKVKTPDSLIGYVESKYLENVSKGEGETIVRQETPVTDFAEPEYPALSLEGKVGLGWHSIGGTNGNGSLKDILAESEGINVIAPTWFSLNDTEGGFRSFASQDYVDAVHKKGLQVWGTWDDFNYNLSEAPEKVDVLASLDSTPVRQKLAEDIAVTAESLGLDGVNIDFESVTSDRGPAFVQFLRELSLACHARNLILSVDNYIPYEYRSYYRLDVQGKVADYVIIMGYDEHTAGGGKDGSVASINFVSEGIDLALAKVPAEKLVNALPFYTVIWTLKGAEVTGKAYSLGGAAEYVADHDVVLEWDEETCQNYGEWTEEDAICRVWMEDAESLGVKLDVMRAKEIGGVAVWQLSYGTQEAWELIQGYVEQ